MCVCVTELETLPTGPERDAPVALRNLPVCCHPLEVAAYPDPHLLQQPPQPLPVMPWSTVLATSYGVMRSARRRSIQTPWVPTPARPGMPRGAPRPRLPGVAPPAVLSSAWARYSPQASVLRSPGLSVDPWGFAANLGLPPSILSCLGTL